MARHAKVTMPYSKLKASVAQILHQEGYVADVGIEEGTKKAITLALKYDGRLPVISGLRQISTPGLRRYVRSTEIPRVLGGMGVAIVSTSKGVMTGSEAKKQNLGGELVCYIW
jgi:small subunit ribosomal protein S8